MIDYANMPREATAIPICDFCSDKDVSWRYPASDFAIDEVKYVSRNDWAACEQCADCIEKRDLKALAKRSSDYKKLVEYTNEEMVIAIIARLHLQFMSHRTGPRIRVRDSLV